MRVDHLPAQLSKIESALKQGPPTDWQAFQHQQGAAFASSDLAQVQSKASPLAP